MNNMTVKDPLRMDFTLAAVDETFSEEQIYMQLLRLYSTRPTDLEPYL
jgi:hypothetical protein